MHITIRHHIALVLLLLCSGLAHSQERRTEIRFEFRVNSTAIDSTWQGNGAGIRKAREILRQIRQDRTITITEISFCGAASPEGSYQLNRRLAQGRLEAVEQFIRSEVHLPDSIITRNNSYIPWEYLKEKVVESALDCKEEVVAILDEEPQLVDYHHPDTHIDNRIVKLKALDGGRVWQQMFRLFFEDMRNACAVFITYKEVLPQVKTRAMIPATLPSEGMPQIEPMEMAPVEEGCSRRLHIKTNAAALGLAMANAAVEMDLAEHWSVTLPVYYSAWDYFKQTIKFRTFAIQPEVRWWLSECNDGFFAGAHLGVAYYNFAFDGDWRYQDHNRNTPSIGGGVSAGYRFPISRNNRWRMEFTLGAGVYSRHYDIFHNTPDTKDGLMTHSIRKTYWGLDQAAVTFSYSIDLKKKGGVR